MNSQPAIKSANIARPLLLAIAAGLLFLRQEFAHRNLGEIPRLWGGKNWEFLQFAYVTEMVLLVLAPLALIQLIYIRSLKHERLPPENESLRGGLGLPFYFVTAFIAWGAAHAVYAFFFTQPRDTYLIMRQSAMAGYALFFVYGLLFFYREKKFIQNAAVLGVAVALLTAVVDMVAAGQTNPAAPDATPRWAQFFNEKPYGQETLPIAILAMGLYVVYSDYWIGKVLIFGALGFAAWRQGLRFQSVVPMSLAGAVAGFALLGVMVASRQGQTLRRALLLLVIFAIGGAGVVYLKSMNKQTVDEDKSEVHAWSPKVYSDLFDIYNNAQIPANPADYVYSTRAGVPVADPEVYRLNAVTNASPDLSVRNNIWRFLVWKRMAGDWREGHTVIGAGVGKPWFYPALYHTNFHYGEDRLGLDPHNSFLNMLYRFGLVGFALVLAAVIAVFVLVIKALRRAASGDVLLEGLALYFFYTVIFSNFTVALEGPAYSMPFWLTLGLMYARARQLLFAADADLVKMPGE